MRRVSSALMTVALVMLASTARAQAATQAGLPAAKPLTEHQRDSIRDRRELRQDRRDTRHDRRDLAQDRKDIRHDAPTP